MLNTVTLELCELVDECFLVSETIKKLEKEHIEVLKKKEELLKSKIKRIMEENSLKNIAGSAGVAEWQTQNRKSLDSELLMSKFNLTPIEIDSCNKHTLVEFVKIKKK